MDRTGCRLDLGNGRVLTYDDVGASDGVAVVYLHGTPDSRLARHPDDSIAQRCGIRLLAVDRPGFGGTSHHEDRSQLAADLRALLDDLELPTVALLGWSSGGLAALAAAGPLGDRCRRAVLVASLPPVEAYRDAAVLGALGPGRRSLAEMAADIDAAELAAEAAPFVVPVPLSPELALDHVREGAGVVGRAELASVPGALEQLAAGLVEGVAQGIAGIGTDLRHQLEPGLPLGGIGLPVHLVHGALDDVAPPSVGRWLADRLPSATLEVVPDGGHHLLFPRWEALMRSLAERTAG